MNMAQLFTAEWEIESQTTRRFLERVPEAQLAWRVHEKSHTVGELALHIARAPAGISAMLAEDRFEMVDDMPLFPQPSSKQQILDAHAQGIGQVRERLSGWSDSQYGRAWEFAAGEKVLMSMPRHVAVRSLVFSHTIHHRGQLGVYLRLLGVAVPWSYGPSGDESPPFLG